MKTTRRQFLTSLLATAATAVIAPQVLVESVHGAAEVMGLRRPSWSGYGARAWRDRITVRTEVRLCAERAVERDQQILWGRPGGQMPVGVLPADGENLYDPESKAFHVRFDEEEIAWRSRELEPDPDQKSPFVRLR